jgi:alpha-1,3-rhamnosyl/mannosyltransferase
VTVGGAPRRGVPVALEAWREVRGRLNEDAVLAVLGEPDLPATPGVVPVGRLSDPDWATLLAGAEALCYPTRYEGFGLPALEAMVSGTPVVAAPVASLPEVVGEAGCWCGALTAGAVAGVLERVLSDPVWQSERRDAGLARAAAAPGWDMAAGALVEAYRRAAR